MWQVVDGRIVFSPVTTHTRSALGFGNVPDAVTLMEVSRGR